MNSFTPPMLSRLALIALIAALAIGGLAPSSVQAAAHTPQPGSLERQAICDALRAYLLARVATRKPPQPIVFKVDVMRVDAGVAWFQGVPLLKDGSYVPDGILPDVGYTFVLQRDGGEWRVKEDLSRSDVPSASEVAQLRAALRDVPTSVIPAFWRQILKR